MKIHNRVTLKKDREHQGVSGREIFNTETGRDLAAVTKCFEKPQIAAGQINLMDNISPRV